MNNSAILNSCIFVSLAFQRADHFDLNQTEAMVLIAIRSFKSKCATYDEIARVTAVSTSTLRATKTSPLSKLGDKGLVESDLLRNPKSRDMKVFRLTDDGEMVLHFLLTGKKREEVKHD